MPSPDRPHRRAISPAIVVAFVLGALAGSLTPSIRFIDRALAAPAPGLANPADDRSRMIVELQRLSASTDAIREAITSGRIKVQIAQQANPAN